MLLQGSASRQCFSCWKSEECKLHATTKLSRTVLPSARSIKTRSANSTGPCPKLPRHPKKKDVRQNEPLLPCANLRRPVCMLLRYMWGCGRVGAVPYQSQATSNCQIFDLLSPKLTPGMLEIMDSSKSPADYRVVQVTQEEELRPIKGGNSRGWYCTVVGNLK